MELSGLVDSCRLYVVAAEVPEHENLLRLYFHDREGFRMEELPFRRFAVLSSPEQISTRAGFTALAGDLPLKVLAEFDSAADYAAALAELRGSKRPWLFFRDPVRQALMRCRVRLFSGMAFGEIRRLSLAVTATDELVSALEVYVDGRAARFTAATPDEERLLLEAFLRSVSEADPDIVEGHELGNRIIPALEKACRRHKLPLALGRGGSVVVRSSGSFTLPEGQMRCGICRAAGRQFIDSWILARLYDARTRVLESCDPPDLAEHFGLRGSSEAERTHELTGILAPAYFYQAQVLPLDFQELPLRGNGGNLDALFISEYLNAGHSLPLPEPPEEFQGALTRAERQGVFRQVRHADVRSLYPSILLAGMAAPARDELRVFPRLLRELRRFRLAAKDAEKNADTPELKRESGALQSAFKILINSFYGYLGFPQGSFNDCALAAEVTRRGREILGAMLDYLNASKAVVIEADTDGVYFQMPEGVESAAFDAGLRGVLPPGIEVEFDAEYPAMFSYKSKNYALLRSDGGISLTGAALKSRALEPFQREFINFIVSALLRGRPETAAAEYERLKREIAEHRLPLEKFAKTEVLNDSPAAYRKKLESGSGRHSAAYDLALAARRVYNAGDRVRFYVTGTQKKPKLSGNTVLLEESDGTRNENVAFYLDKLEALYNNYRPFLDGAAEGK